MHSTGIHDFNVFDTTHLIHDVLLVGSTFVMPLAWNAGKISQRIYDP